MNYIIVMTLIEPLVIKANSYKSNTTTNNNNNNDN